VQEISWDGMHYRKDIAQGRLARVWSFKPETLNARPNFGGILSWQTKKPRVGILMGSDSDLEVMREAEKRLDSFGIGYETRIMSAHRTPDKAAEYAATAEQRGLEVIICGAGAAAHLAGAIAANTTLPVIGIPIDSSSLKGLDALLATVQMPAGIPVATMAIGKAGAANAGIFAAQIIGRKDEAVAAKLPKFKKEMAAGVEERDRKLQSERKKS
jgi:phosphoribosylaminoimidazole carboxylase PurE protein